MVEQLPARRPVPTNTGNPRIAVAFPFSKIEISGDGQPVAQLARVVRDMAEQVAALAREVAPDRVDALDRVVEEAGHIADRADER